MASLATIRADVWNTIYSALTAASTTTSIATHTNTFPDLNSGNPSFPLLVIDNPRPTRSIDNSSVSDNNPIRPTEVELTLYTKSSLQVDTVSDAVCNQIETVKNTSFFANNICQIEIIDGGHTVFILEDGSKLHEKALLLRFVCLT